MKMLLALSCLPARRCIRFWLAMLGQNRTFRFLCCSSHSWWHFAIDREQLPVWFGLWLWKPPDTRENLCSSVGWNASSDLCAFYPRLAPDHPI